ncbi:phosphopantetheine attachment site domain-containing protein [Hirsutella rhossiliensis]|uniref:Phosphopantetheine attachment site domain-containing protein n=1 Tax=Hirsutella rhossiliensis TaxID=111463 RepID=A0A9P8SJD6_9HYPO|nr:phosphopantetheine attachment site domain-containing protein [Hirsutella rhossiliensis]KAH0964786.1 phosphopantetheine attachment site domain-containing protein [Hirsutella rhossiliensis]
MAELVTASERTLRCLWASFLVVQEEELALDDNFFRLGGDSIMAMRTVSALRLAGYGLSVADILRYMQLWSISGAMVDVPPEAEQLPKAYASFSLLDSVDVDNFISANVCLPFADASWAIQDVLPVTDPQERDVMATVFALRSAVQYNMLYVDKSIETSRLLESFQHLVDKHPILRTVFVQHNDPKSKSSFITKPIDVSGRPLDITLATFLTASWAKVVAQLHNVSDVIFAGIVSGRSVEVAGIYGNIRTCYRYMPVRVVFEPGWTAGQLLYHVRDQYLDGSRHATLGFRELLQECATGWPSIASFFPSFVNHVDKGYFDAISFAGSRCRVDYTTPPPEPSTPPRAVSFVEAGKTCVGIEADEARRKFWEARLGELVSAKEGFVEHPQAMAL